MKKIKVAFVCTKAYPLFNPKCEATFGGSEVQIAFLSKELAKDKNYDVYLLTGDFGQENKEEYSKVKVHKTYSLKKSVFNYLKAPFKLYFKLKKVNPDVIIQRAHGPETGICTFYSKLNKKKFIYSIAHDKDVTGLNSKGIFGKIFDYGIKNADFYIAQSHFQEKKLRKYLNKNINSQVIKSGYKISEKNSKNKKYVLWVGRYIDWKRPELYLELAQKIPKEKFLLIMPKGSDLKKWKEIVDKTKKMKNIKFIEKVPFHKIQTYFDKAKLFINTSVYEGFPNTFIQSCLGQTPIISLNVNPDNVLTKNKLGLNSEDNFDKLVNNTKQILENKELHKKFSKNTLKYAKKEHDITKIIEKWKKIIT